MAINIVRTPDTKYFTSSFFTIDSLIYWLYAVDYAVYHLSKSTIKNSNKLYKIWFTALALRSHHSTILKISIFNQNSRNSFAKISTTLTLKINKRPLNHRRTPFTTGNVNSILRKTPDVAVYSISTSSSIRRSIKSTGNVIPLLMMDESCMNGF